MTSMSRQNAMFERGLLGRRHALRLPLRIPAKLESVFDRRDCVVVDVSRYGALLRLAHPLLVGTSAYLRAGPLEVFATAVRDGVLAGGGSITGVVFDVPLDRDQFQVLRIYAREYRLVERRVAAQAARDWAGGIGR